MDGGWVRLARHRNANSCVNFRAKNMIRDILTGERGEGGRFRASYYVFTCAGIAASAAVHLSGTAQTSCRTRDTPAGLQRLAADLALQCAYEASE